MDEILQYKKRIIRNLIILLVLLVTSVFVIISAASGLKSQTSAIVILIFLLIEIPVIFNLSFSGIRAINLILDNEEKQMSSNEEIEKLEQEVEEKAKEAEVLSFNFNQLTSDIGEFDNIESFGQKLLSGISKQIDIVVGVFYHLNTEENKFQPIANYAYYSNTPPNEFIEGEGLNGQCVKDKKAMYLEEMPKKYINVVSGLGNSEPKNLLILPLIHKKDVVGLIEIATFKNIDRGVLNRTDEISEFIGSLIGKLG